MNPAFSDTSFSTSAFSVDAWAFGSTTAQRPSGGYYDPPRKRRTKEDIRADRIRFGVLQEPKAVEAVEEVAKTVIQTRDSQLALKEQEQAELLQRMLTERGIILKAVPRIELVLMTVIRQEIQRQENEDWAIVELMFNEL